MTSIPPFENELLNEIAEAYRKRRKSLKHRNSRPEFYKVYEQGARGTVERLEIVLEDGTKKNSAVLRLNAWPDRYVSVGVRNLGKSAPGWSWAFEGRLLRKFSGRDMLAALEATLDLLPRTDGLNTEMFNSPWKPLLARGPSEIHRTA